jgi:putative oxidoreductase
MPLLARPMQTAEAVTIPRTVRAHVRRPSLAHGRGTMVEDGMTDLALLLLRVVTGGLLAGHGAQKLFGSFSGPGFKGTAGWMETMGLRPGMAWAGMAVGGEFAGGLLTLLGLGGPLGSILTTSAMKMATFKAHSGKPIWVTAGGAELPVVNIAVSTALMMIGPGKYSLDRLLGIKVPRWLTGLVMAGASVSLVVGLLMEPDEAAESATSEAA